MKNIVKTSLILLLIIALTFTFGCNAVTDSGPNTSDTVSVESTTGNTQNETTSEKESGTISDIPTSEQLRDEFYGNSDPADSYEEAIERSSRGELSGADKEAYIESLTREMKKAAEKLDFERAAHLRDRIRELKTTK